MVVNWGVATVTDAPVEDTETEEPKLVVTEMLEPSLEALESLVLAMFSVED